VTSPTWTLRALPLEPSPLGYEKSRSVRILFLLVVSVGFGVFLATAALTIDRLPNEWSTYLVWLAALLATELLSVPVWGSISLSVSLPIILAAGILFPPAIVGPLAFLGSIDRRELRHDIGLLRALYNRSQVMLSALAASIVFHGLHGNLYVWPAVIGISLVIVVVDFIINIAFVALPIRLHMNVELMEVVRNIFGAAPVEHAITHICLGLLSLPLALTYRVAGVWAVLALLSPLVLIRQMLAHSRRLDRATELVDRKNRALASTVDNAAAERRDERLIVAGGLHDEVIQPLYKVHLMGQVLRQDLATGRLLELDEDLPPMIEATDAAQAAIRRLIRGLRSSVLGPEGLAPTLGLLVRDVRSETDADIDLQADEVGGAATTQLLAYQVVREALSNCIRHANATRIEIRVSRSEDDIRVLIEDDGIGFQPELVDQQHHFGLQMLIERVESFGGMASIESRPGSGTRIQACLRADGPWRL
jgi:signal transduction histidine kinase